MSPSTRLLHPDGNSPFVDGFSPFSRGGIKHRLAAKLVLKGFTERSFAQRYNLKWRDVGNFLRKKYDRIGRKAKQKIREALVAEGLLKPRRVRSKFPCPTCGRLMREPASKKRQAMDNWLNKRVSAKAL